MPERTAKTILLEMVGAVKAGSVKDLNNPQLWLNRAFELNILLLDEKDKCERLRQAVAIKKLAVYQGQEKKNVSAADMEIRTLDDYRDMKIQEGVIEIIEEQIKLAKKNSGLNSY